MNKRSGSIPLQKVIWLFVLFALVFSVYARFPMIYYHAHPNMNFTREMFEVHMDYLAQEGFTTVTMDDFLDWYHDNAIMPLHPIVIGFDDNLVDTYHKAYPVLKERGFVAINYAITDSIDRPSVHERCDWNQIHEMEDAGVFFTESHSHTHPHMATLSETQITYELVESKNILEENLERDIIHFAYPYGSYNQTVVDLTEQAGYETAVTTIQDFNYQDTPLLELRRFSTDGLSLPDFKSKLQWSDREPPPYCKSWIIDNIDTNFSVLSGDWTLQYDLTAREGSYRLGPAEVDTGTVRWAAYMQDEGYYRLKVWIPAIIENTGMVSYDIHHEGTVTEVMIDQNQPESGWHDLGVFHFDGNTPVKVTLQNIEGYNVIADALLIQTSKYPLPDIEMPVEKLWAVMAGEYDWFTDNYRTYSAAMNPVTGNVLVAAWGDESPGLKVLSFVDGSLLGELPVPAGKRPRVVTALPSGTIIASVSGGATEILVWEEEDIDGPDPQVVSHNSSISSGRILGAWEGDNSDIIVMTGSRDADYLRYSFDGLNWNASEVVTNIHGNVSSLDVLDEDTFLAKWVWESSADNSFAWYASDGSLVEEEAGFFTHCHEEALVDNLLMSNIAETSDSHRYLAVSQFNSGMDDYMGIYDLDSGDEIAFLTDSSLFINPAIQGDGSVHLVENAIHLEREENRLEMYMTVAIQNNFIGLFRWYKDHEEMVTSADNWQLFR